jgi:hypothetical protein
MTELNHANYRKIILHIMGNGNSIKKCELNDGVDVFLKHFGRRDDLNYSLVMDGEHINKIYK